MPTDRRRHALPQDRREEQQEELAGKEEAEVEGSGEVEARAARSSVLMAALSRARPVASHGERLE